MDNIGLKKWGRSPKKDMSYISNSDILIDVWDIKDSLEYYSSRSDLYRFQTIERMLNTPFHCFYIKKGTKLYNLKLGQGLKGYDFELEDGRKYHTDYPWTIIEDTEENRAVLNKLKDKCAEIDKLRSEMDIIRKNLKTLEH